MCDNTVLGHCVSVWVAALLSNLILLNLNELVMSVTGALM